MNNLDKLEELNRILRKHRRAWEELTRYDEGTEVEEIRITYVDIHQPPGTGATLRETGFIHDENTSTAGDSW